MGEIFKPTEDTYYRAYGPDGTIHEGVTPAGYVTTTGQPSFIYSADPAEYGGQVAAVADLPDLPPEPEGTNLGEWLERGQVYDWEGRAVVVVQSHNRQRFAPDVTPALFVFARTTEEWEVGVVYNVGDEVTYLGNTYRCLQAHTSQAGWTPTAVPALWALQ